MKVIKICDVIDNCTECPRYADDCDGRGGDAEMRNDRTPINEPYMQQSRHDDGKIDSNT